MFFALFACLWAFAACSSSDEVVEPTPQPEPERPEVETLTLTASKPSIWADGEDMLVFTAMLGDKDVSANCQFCSDAFCLTTPEFRSVDWGVYSVVAKYDDPATGKHIESNAVEVEVKAPLVFTASKTEIMGDGKDEIVFKVMYKDEDVSEACQFCTEDHGGFCYASPHFRTMSEPGVYNITAKYDDPATKQHIESKPLAITITQPAEPVKLSADKTEITADGADFATLKVMQGTKDVTSSAQFTANGEKMLSNRFATTTAGEYTLEATYADPSGAQLTDRIVVKALPSLLLTADKDEITANGRDEVAFRVTSDGTDITAFCKFFVNDAPAVNPFSTTTPGTYAVYAVDGTGAKTNTLSIKAVAEEMFTDGFDISRTLPKTVLYMQYTRTACPTCDYYRDQMTPFAAAHPDVINVRMYGANDGTPAHRYHDAAEYNRMISDLHNTGYLIPVVNQFPWNFVEYREQSKAYNIEEHYDTYRTRGAFVAFKVTSKMNSATNTVEAQLTMASKREDTYRVVALLIDGDGILRDVATNIVGDEFATLKMGEAARKSYTFDYAAYVNRGQSVDSYRVVFVALHEEEGRWVTVNSVSVPADTQDSDFRYAE